jgi:hypothetical protein
MYHAADKWPPRPTTRIRVETQVNTGDHGFQKSLQRHRVGSPDNISQTLDQADQLIK